MKGFIVLIFLCLFHLLPAQENIDSLKRVWENYEQYDSVRLKSINRLSWDGFLFSMPDSAIYYAQLHYDFAKELGHRKEMAVAKNTQATAFYLMGDHAKAINLYYESLKAKEEIKDTLAQAVSWNNIGMVNDEQGFYDEAIENYKKAIAALNSIEDKSSAELQTTLAASYQNLGVSYTDTNPELALEYFYKALKIADSLKLERDQAYTYNNLANIYLDQNDKAKALEYYQRGVELLKKLGDEGGIIDGINNIAIFYLETEDYRRSIQYANQALNRAKSNASKVGIRDAAEILYECYKALGNNKQALSFFELHTEVRDSLNNDSNRKEVVRQTYKYNYEKQLAADSIVFATSQEMKNMKIAEQEAQLQLEESKRLLLYVVIGMLIILTAIIFRGYRRNLKTSAIIAEQKEEVESQRDKITDQHAQLEEKNREITDFNNNLEALVAERTKELEESINQIRKYQHDLAHNIRAPYVSLMGLLNLIKDERFDSKDNEKVLHELQVTGEKISRVLSNISSELSESQDNVNEGKKTKDASASRHSA